jgi:hypothetical protein
MALVKVSGSPTTVREGCQVPAPGTFLVGTWQTYINARRCHGLYLLTVVCVMAQPRARRGAHIRGWPHQELETLLDIYEQRLGESEYLAGNKFFTIADLSHLPNADRLASDPRSRKNVSRWWDAISCRGAWQEVKNLQHPPTTAQVQRGAGQELVIKRRCTATITQGPCYNTRTVTVFQQTNKNYCM